MEADARSSHSLPVVFCWRPLAPVAAWAGLWFFSRAWNQPLPAQAWLVVGLCAWGFAVLAEWPGLVAARQQGVALVVVAVALAVAAGVAGGRLPSGLFLAAIPVAGLAVMQALMTLGQGNRVALRIAVVVGLIGAALALVALPLGWPAPLRIGLLAVAVGVSWSVWSGADRVQIAELPLVAARGLVFAAGLLLPGSWWMPGALATELVRPENLLFVCLALIAAGHRSTVRREGEANGTAALLAVAALVVALLGALGGSITATAPVRIVFLGVSVAGTILAVGIWLTRRSAGARWPRGVVADAVWLALPFVSWAT